jgi:formylmethanofuran dehydrogenase subunit A
VPAEPKAKEGRVYVKKGKVVEEEDSSDSFVDVKSESEDEKQKKGQPQRSR